jgi:hypothetical protein
MSDCKRLDLKVMDYRDEQLLNFLYDWGNQEYALKEVKRPGQSSQFKGFHYFSPYNLFENDRDLQFLVAHEGGVKAPGSIIGVVKLGTFSFCGSLPDYTGICYIDVREDRRQMGVATEMIKSFNEHLAGKRWLVGSRPSELGMKCHLKDIIRRELNVCPYFGNTETFAEYVSEHNIQIS